MSRLPRRTKIPVPYLNSSLGDYCSFLKCLAQLSLPLGGCFKCICSINSRFYFNVKNRALFREEGSKELIQIWISDHGWVCRQPLPHGCCCSDLQILEEELTHGSLVTSGTSPGRGTDVKLSPGFKRRKECGGWEAFWGGSSSVHCRTSLRWNGCENTEANYPMCLPCRYKMYWIVTAGSIPVTTAGEILNTYHDSPTI